MTEIGPFPAFPSGWFKICQSSDLDSRRVLPARLCGQDLVVYRQVGGAVTVLDAHCPHLGAHLGYGGVVDGAGIRCPFHKWRFDPDGWCDSVPYSSGSTPRASLRVWPSLEQSGVVFAYHADDGHEPTWRPQPFLPLIEESGWTPFKVYEWDLRMHCQEMVENLADTVHFRYVHGTPSIPNAITDIDGAVYRQTMVGYGDDETEEYRNQYTAYGLGILWMMIPDLEIVALTTATQIDADTTRLGVHLSAREAGAVLSDRNKERFEMIIESTSADFPIWENRRYPSRPHLLAQDSTLMAARRWARQFYSTKYETTEVHSTP